MKTVGFTLLIALTLALSGCKKDEGGGDEGSGGETAGEQGSKEGGEGGEGGGEEGGEGGDDKGADDGLANKMKNCPSAIEGATTKVEVADKKVVVSIEVGEGHIDDAVERVKHLQGLDIKEPDEVKHSGEGTGGARGPCPLVTTMSKIETFEAEGGTLKVTLAANNDGDTQKLADTLKERAEALAKKAGGGTHDGSGKGGGTGGGGGDGSGGGEGDGSGGGDGKGGDDGKGKSADKKPKKPAKDEGGW